MTPSLALPLPDPPKDPAKMADWLEQFRNHAEVRRLEAELSRLESENERAETDRLKAIAERTAIALAAEKATLDIERARIELAQLRRDEQETVATARNAMVYAFYKDVDDESVADAVSTLDEWSRANPGEAIEIQLTSPGGYVLDGLALFDFLRSLSARGHHVIVTVLGFAASMGAVLLQAGDERRIGANSFVMIHEVAAGARGKVADLEEQVEFTRRLQERLVRILCARTDLTPAKVREMWRKRDVWLDAKEAKKLNIIDAVIS